MSDSIKAVPSLIFEGDKRNITALFIQVRNVDENEREKLLGSILKNIYLNRAVLSKSPEKTFLALFNVEGIQSNHELIAVNTALAIQNEIKNIKSLKIGFGINSGRAIVSPVEETIIKYTCIGNFINLTKKLSTKSENNVLFTKDIYDKVSTNLKADEVKDLFNYFNMKVYSLSRLIDREKYTEYTKDFMSRMRI